MNTPANKNIEVQSEGHTIMLHCEDGNFSAANFINHTTLRKDEQVEIITEGGGSFAYAVTTPAQFVAWMAITLKHLDAKVDLDLAKASEAVAEAVGIEL